MKSKPLFLLLLFSFLVSLNLFAQSSIDQTVVSKQLDYFNSQIKKHENLPSFNSQISAISSSQYELQKPSDALSFDCGYVDNSGNVYVSEPTTSSQREIFGNITEASIYYLNLAYLKYFFQTDKMPLWFKVGFAAFEADLKISDSIIKSAINKYGGFLPSFSTLNDQTLFDKNDGIAISFLWGELMNVVFGWWKYNDIESLTSDAIVMGSWTKSTDEMFKLFRRYLNMRIMESNESYRVKFQSESEHFKLYYRDAENYCFPYIKDALETAYSQYSNELKISAPKKLTYSTQPECEGAKLDSIPCPGRYTGGTAWASGLTTSCADKVEDLPKFRDLVRHELAHTFQFLITPSYMPAWLSEGFASFLPDGLFSDQTIRNLSGEVNARFEETKANIGHYPTISELEDYSFCSTNGINYYLIGLVMNDFILRNGDYTALKNAVKSKGQDFSAMNFSTKQQFETAFYDNYNSMWKPKPKSISIKKVLNKPQIDGKLSEASWEKNIVINRKFWMDYYMNVVPDIDNNVTASAMYDDENLYIAMEIIDGNISTNGWVNHQKDGVEVDIDPDLSRGINFKDDDMAFIWSVGENPSYRSNLTGATVVYSPTSQGYSVEIAIPWSKLNITPSAGYKFGLELCNYDCDDGSYKGALIYSGHSWNNGIVLNGLAEVSLSNEFITVPKSCKILSPVGGEVYVSGEKEIIEWEANSVTNLKIEFSSDNGATWNTVAENVPAASKNYAWTVPDNVTQQGKVKVTDQTDNTIYGISETQFAITTPKVLGPYLSDNNTALLMHFNNNLQNKSNSGDGLGSSLSYQNSVSTELGVSLKLQSPIVVPHNVKLNLTGDWTIEAWIKLNSYPTADGYILAKPGDNDSYFANYALEVNPYWGNIFYGFNFSQGNNRIGVQGVKPSLNKWYHVAFTRDSQKKQLKLVLRDENKSVVSSLDYTYAETSVLTSSKDLVIGNGLDAYIDELRISNVVRDFTAWVESEDIMLPTQFLLKQNYPNPFNPITRIRFDLPVNSHTKLIIYDILGKEISTLLNADLGAGYHEVEFNGSNLPSGIYIYRIQAGEFTSVKKMILMK